MRTMASLTTSLKPQPPARRDQLVTVVPLKRTSESVLIAARL